MPHGMVATPPNVDVVGSFGMGEACTPNHVQPCSCHTHSYVPLNAYVQVPNLRHDTMHHVEVLNLPLSCLTSLASAFPKSVVFISILFAYLSETVCLPVPSKPVTSKPVYYPVSHVTITSAAFCDANFLRLGKCKCTP